MGSYRVKTETELTWADNRNQIRLDLRKILQRVENKVLGQASQMFDQAVAEGKLLEQRFSEGEIVSLVKEEVARLPAPKKLRG